MRTESLRRDGRTLHVTLVGDGEPLVFLHGLGSRGTTALPLLGDLPGFQLVLPD